MQDFLNDTTIQLAQDSLKLIINNQVIFDSVITDIQHSLNLSQDTLSVRNIKSLNDTLNIKVVEQKNFDLPSFFSSVATLAALISTYYSYKAVKSSQDQKQQDLKNRKSQSTHQYYELIILQPCTSTINNYVDFCKNLLSDTPLNCSESDLKRLYEKWMTRHDEFLRFFHSRLKHWIDDTLVDSKMDIILMDLEESVWEIFFSKEETGIEIRQLEGLFLNLIDSRVGEVYAILKDNDPLFKMMEDH